VLDLITKDAITQSQAEKKLRDLKDREAGLREELDRLAEALAGMPDEDTLRCYVEQIESSIMVLDAEGNERYGGNSVASWLVLNDGDHEADRRALIDAAFVSPMPDGKPSGVYVTRDGAERQSPKHYEIKGVLAFCSMPRACC
jgi:hypothetical protein